jgi:DNA-binding NtrC family response regulator
MKRGAFNYLVKPFNQDEMLVVARKALETTRLRRELERVRQSQKRQYGTENLVGKSQKMLEVCERIREGARSAATTGLVQGESGTGKDLVAKAIHFSSDRSTNPFMNITCSALPETLLESELMGYEKGAFTDAREMKRGLLEVADGGTVFLDEIGDMGIGLQAKLLRFLEDKVIRRVGGSRDMGVNVRIVAATNRDLDQAVRDGNFREDLYYRLKVIPVEMPPLRERPEDIPLLVTHFVELFNAEFRKNTRGFTAEALKCCEQYDWPGNVRELRNVVERAMILENKEFLGSEDLPPAIREEVTKEAAEGAGDGSSAGGFALPDEGCGLRQMEEQMVRRALEKTNGNQSRAAQLHFARFAAIQDEKTRPALALHSRRPLGSCQGLLHGAWLRREDQVEGRPLSRCAVNGDFSAMVLDRSMYQGQAEPRSVRLGGEERLEDLVSYVILDPDPVVADGDVDSILHPLRAHLDLAALGDCLVGVLDQILEGVPELPGIGIDLRDPRVQIQNEIRFGHGGKLANGSRRLLEDQAHVYPFRVELPGLRVGT